ncbi:hypothetical protein VV02_08285 [Luteipulveratus mongoliensis]|uniref:AB hydrolase-1 domain-containing protein n=2 Tax=Luteipulveratus mongoliensis TaxID=571913 RepID=A0A0K1JPW1_9MICO|nr:hypothetical protein VV02_08285 [Luteipulveratus mongoliensis]
MYVVEDGPSDASVVVLIHGYAGSTLWWEPLVPALAADRRVVRVDLLGHGRSTSSTTGYGIADQARRIAAVADALGVETCAVVGHSTGGQVATALAEQRPDLVTRLALIDTGPHPDAFRAQGRASRLVALRGIGPLAWRLRSDSSIREGLTGAVSGDIDLSDQIVADVKAMTYQAFSQTPKAGLAYVGERSVPLRLADLDVPTLVIFGVDDRRWRSSAAEDYRTIAGARLELLPGIGHTPMLESPALTGELLAAFLA